VGGVEEEFSSAPPTVSVSMGLHAASRAGHVIRCRPDDADFEVCSTVPMRCAWMTATHPLSLIGEQNGLGE
jgi:hypothetical protein